MSEATLREPQPAVEPGRAHALRFFARCGFTPDEAEKLADIAEKVERMFPAGAR